jgi:hypothetical protein
MDKRSVEFKGFSNSADEIKKASQAAVDAGAKFGDVPGEGRGEISAAAPVLFALLAVVGVVALAAVAGGFYAIQRNSVGSTVLDLFGMHLTTSHVGVALVGIGAAIAIFVLRRLLKTLEFLGKL